MGYIGLSFGKFGVAKVNSYEGFRPIYSKLVELVKFPYGIKVLNRFAHELRSDPRHGEELHSTKARYTYIYLDICIFMYVYIAYYVMVEIFHPLAWIYDY